MRLSLHTVLVNLHDELSLLYNRCFGTWDIINFETREILETNQISKLTAKQLKYMKSRYYLTELNYQNELAKTLRIGAELRRRARGNGVFVFTPTLSCNLVCPYCFQASIRTNTDYSNDMDKRQVDSAFQGIEKIVRMKSIENPSVCLFGGEPFMQKMYDISSYIIEQAVIRNYSVSVITNGAQLNLFEKYLGNNGVKNICVTIDGPANMHDLRRCYANGCGTFDDIVNNVDLALSNGVEVLLRINIDNITIDCLPQLVDYFFQRKWLDNPYFRAHIGFIDLPQQNMEEIISITNKTIEIVYAINRKYGKMVLSLFEGTVSGRISSVINGKEWGRVPIHCFSQFQIFIFAPDSNIYSCWRMIGDSINKIGTYDPKLELNYTRMNFWFTQSSLRNKACHTCPHMFSCGGGCGKKRIENNLNCDEFDKLFKAELRSQFLSNELMVKSEYFSKLQM